MTRYYDVLIIGGGLVGASFALALKNSGLKLLIVEATTSTKLQDNDFDARSIALSKASKQILSSLSVWPAIEPYAMPIKKIHVSKKSQFGHTLLDHKKYNFDAFGYVAEIGYLNQAMQQALLNENNITYLCPAKLKKLVQKKEFVEATIEQQGKNIAVAAKLVVAADGTNSFVRKQLGLKTSSEDYRQTAVVANIGLRRTHHNHAYERFTSNGLIALLPMVQKRASLVWATSEEEANNLINLPEQDFLEKLQQQFGYRLGRFEKAGKRGKFPLKLQYMENAVVDRVVFIGNASQTLHPVAGQGFNLGLRDQAILAELIFKDKYLNNPVELLKNYQSQRHPDQKRIINATSRLVKFFALNSCPFDLLQSLSLISADLISPLKKSLVDYAMGFSAQNSKLACGIDLDSPVKAG